MHDIKIGYDGAPILVTTADEARALWGYVPHEMSYLLPSPYPLEITEPTEEDHPCLFVS